MASKRTTNKYNNTIEKAGIQKLRKEYELSKKIK